MSDCNIMVILQWLNSATVHSLVHLKSDVDASDFLTRCVYLMQVT